MATSPISATSSSQLTLQDYLKILSAQLQYQDPLEPTNNQEFLAQTAQFSQLEQSRQLNEKIDSLLQLQSATQSIGLIGKTVDYSGNAGGSVVTGQVTGMTFSNGEPRLTVLTGTTSVPNITLSQIVEVR